MGLLERIQAARAPRSWPVGAGAVPPFEEFHGHDVAEYSPEEYGNYVVTSNEIFAAATLRARLMSGLNLQLFRGRGTARTEVLHGPAVELLGRVNPYWSPRRLERMDELSMCLWGQSFWAIEKDGAGLPQEIWWMKPSRVRPVPHETGYISEFLYEPLHGGPVISFRPDEVVWFRYPNPLDEFAPLSPVAASRLAADTASSMMKANRNLFTNGLMPGGVVVPTGDKVTFTSEQARDLAAMLERRFKGVDKAHRWQVLRFDAQLKEMGVTPKDAEFLGGLNLTLRQVANAYGIPVPLLNDLEHATLSNVRDLQTIMWSHTLKPDSQLRASEITEQFLPMFRRRGGPEAAEYDYTKVEALQEATTEVWARERQAIEVGRYTINEIRAKNGEPPLPWGDVWWAPVNKSAVLDADSRPQGDTSPTGGAGQDTTSDVAGLGEQDGPADTTTVDDRAWRRVLAAFNGPGGGA